MLLFPSTNSRMVQYPMVQEDTMSGSPRVLGDDRGSIGYESSELSGVLRWLKVARRCNLASFLHLHLPGKVRRHCGCDNLIASLLQGGRTLVMFQSSVDVFVVAGSALKWYPSFHRG
jgi:hypothetical protein